MGASVQFLFENASQEGGVRLGFTDPFRMIVADRADQVPMALDALDKALAAGNWIAGYFAYELGYVLEPRLASLLPPNHGPLLRLGVFERPSVPEPFAASSTSSPHLSQARNAAIWELYARAFARAHEYIFDGDAYQINLTFPLAFESETNGPALYTHLRGQARAAASAYLQFEDEEILSFSPETFFTVRGSRIATRPMKGTAARGLTAEQDLAAKRRLRADPKERAENLMIVDLLRNDLARIAEPGSVHVTDLFTVETMPRLHTMTSGISATLRNGTTLSQILRALHPCGSVTGAPKIRAMEIIRELEAGPRGVYCGAVGFAGPGVAAFNVAIRTLRLANGHAVMPVGSGVVADSNAEREFEECLLKARFLNADAPEFSLLETFAWSKKSGLAFAEAHAERLAASAAYFGFHADPIAIFATLQEAAQAGYDHAKLRLLLDRNGRISVSATELTQNPETVWRFRLADAAIYSLDWRQHHKTTLRVHYDQALAHARTAGVDELIFVNEHGEIVEGAISNIFLQFGDQWVTPPLTSGALNGCFRRSLFDSGFPIIEQTVMPEDLTRAKAVWFGNAVRGFIRGVAMTP